MTTVTERAISWAGPSRSGPARSGPAREVWRSVAVAQRWRGRASRSARHFHQSAQSLYGVQVAGK